MSVKKKNSSFCFQKIEEKDTVSLKETKILSVFIEFNRRRKNQWAEERGCERAAEEQERYIIDV